MSTYSRKKYMALTKKELVDELELVSKMFHDLNFISVNQDRQINDATKAMVKIKSLGDEKYKASVAKEYLEKYKVNE